MPESWDLTDAFSPQPGPRFKTVQSVQRQATRWSEPPTMAEWSCTLALLAAKGKVRPVRIDVWLDFDRALYRAADGHGPRAQRTLDELEPDVRRWTAPGDAGVLLSGRTQPCKQARSDKGRSRVPATPTRGLSLAQRRSGGHEGQGVSPHVHA